MWLKVLTSASLLFGFVLLLIAPWVYGQRPGLHTHHAPLRELQEFQVMFAGYIGTSIFSFMTAACLSVLLIRQAKEEYSALATENLRGLVEGSLEDLRSRNKPEAGE